MSSAVEQLRIGARYRLVGHPFDMYDTMDSYSACHEICEGEEFFVLGVTNATTNGKSIGYPIYKVLVQSGDVGYVGYPIFDACVEIE